MSKLYRSRANRVIGGVCGGLGEYFGIDPVIVRLLFILLGFCGGNGLLIYGLAWVLVPEDPVSAMDGPGVSARPVASSVDRHRLLGAILLIIGVILLAERAGLWLDLAWLLPIGLVVAGLIVLLKGRR